MKLTLTNVARFKNDKEGNPLKTKDGREYTRLVIKTLEYADKPISGFDSKDTMFWKEGMVVDAEVETKGEYLNFKVPKKEDLFDERLSQLETRVKMLEAMIKSGAVFSGNGGHSSSTAPDDSVDESEIPF